MENSNKRSVGLIVFSIITFLLLIASGFLNLILIISLAFFGAGSPTPQAGKYKVKVIEGKGKDQILIIPISGVIQENIGWKNKVSFTENIRQKLKQALHDDSVKGVILHIDSPGGTITATDKIYEYIMEFKQKSKKPIVAYLDRVAASGGYYIAVSSDKIVSRTTTITGSIGVIMGFFEIQELLEKKLGIKSIVLKTGKHKDMGSFSRPIQDSEKKIFEGIINEMYERFVEVILEGRKNLTKEKLLKLADGRIYSGKQALKNGLIDKTGNFYTAVDEVIELANINKTSYQIVSYEQTKSLFEELLNPSLKNDSINIILQNTIENYKKPCFYYIWNR